MSGVGLAQILLAGEWRSSAFLRYISKDKLDASMFLGAAIDSDVGDQSDEVGAAMGVGGGDGGSCQP